MKTKLIILTALLIITGCAALDKAYNKEVVTDASGTHTNLVANPNVTTTVQTVGALPIPFAGTAAAVLGLLYSSYAAARNKKLAVALVQGIEAGREFLNTTTEGQAYDAKIKDLLIKHQEAAGVLQAASKLVNEYTSNTVK